LESIYNYHKVNETISTSGQPTKEQLLVIREAGFKVIINLAPHGAENSLSDEALLVQELGLKYIHIPVNFKNPTSENFQEFVDSMRASNIAETWVHCAANMRVSAFVYKYRCEVLNDDRQKAREDLAQIWAPIGVWKQFISKTQ
jgi:protein tyrosine phosphatase (PTP) superfamily phosphohydrolase (DUF442 family)